MGTPPFFNFFQIQKIFSNYLILILHFCRLALRLSSTPKISSKPVREKGSPARLHVVSTIDDSKLSPIPITAPRGNPQKLFKANVPPKGFF